MIIRDCIHQLEYDDCDSCFFYEFCFDNILEYVLMLINFIVLFRWILLNCCVICSWRKFVELCCVYLLDRIIYVWGIILVEYSDRVGGWWWLSVYYRCLYFSNRYLKLVFIDLYGVVIVCRSILWIRRIGCLVMLWWGCGVAVVVAFVCHFASSVKLCRVNLFFFYSRFFIIT